MNAPANQRSTDDTDAGHADGTNKEKTTATAAHNANATTTPRLSPVSALVAVSHPGNASTTCARRSAARSSPAAVVITVAHSGT